MRSQIGYIILLVDAENKCHVLDFKSQNNKRVTRSILGAEVCAFAEAFDRAYLLKRDLEAILQQYIPLSMMTDSKSLFDVIIKCSDTTEKSLLIDLFAVREGYRRQDISNIGHIRSEFNPADSFTKLTSSAVLDSVLTDNMLQHPIAKWVICQDSSKTQDATI